MLNYTMKDKGLSTSEGFVFLDESENVAYRMTGMNMKLTKDYTLTNADGAEVLHLKQKLISLAPTYTVTRGSDACATIRLPGGKYLIDTPERERTVVEKSTGGLQYTFKRNSRPVATVRRKAVSLLEHNFIEVEEPKDVEMVIAVVALIRTGAF